MAGGGFGGGCADWCWVEVSTCPNLDGLNRSQPSQPGSGPRTAGPYNEVVKPAMTSQEGTPSGLVTLGLFKKIEMLSLAMTVVMKLELILKHFKTALKDFKVFTGLGLHHLTTSTGGWPGGLSETGNKAI